MQTLNPFDPVENITLTDRVYSELGRAIMMGRFRPGDILTIRNLAAMFGTSTQPVREAVNRLAAGKALTAYANRSIKLPKLSLEEVNTLWAVRAFIEGEAAAQAAARATDDDRRGLDDTNRELLSCIAKRDIDQIVSKNHKFHFAIYRAAHNDPLYGIIESLWLQSGPYLACIYTAPKNRRPTASQHPPSNGTIVLSQRSNLKIAKRRDLRLPLTSKVQQLFTPTPCPDPKILVRRDGRSTNYEICVRYRRNLHGSDRGGQ